MHSRSSPLTNWAKSERAAWALSAPKWKLMAHFVLGMAVGLAAGLMISDFAG